MKRLLFLTPLLCLSGLISACASHWQQGVNLVYPPTVPITSTLTLGDLRVALTDCVVTYDKNQLSKLNDTGDDRLRSILTGEPLQFDKCMSAKGWIPFPDYVLAP